MTRAVELPLYWRVCLINGTVFALGTAALVLSPASISSRAVLSEVLVLSVGLVVIIVTNSLLLRPSLTPLDRLTGLMARVDLLQPGERLPETGNGNVAHVIESFNAMLDRLEQERGTSSGQALSAQEAERQRIAQELHDEVGQSLTAVLLGLKRCADRAPAGLGEDLRQLQETTRSSLEEVRRLAQRLRPTVLEDLGLLSALTSLAGDVATHSGLEVRRRIEPGALELTSEAELVVYRVAQEALTNVERHAGARAAEVELSRRSDAVVLRVTDDGNGREGTSEGAGIRGMRERALLVNAELSFATPPGGGTVVTLVVPA